MHIRTILSLASGVLVLLVALSTLFGSWYTVDQGDRGVLLRNGALVETVEPGLHFKIPWIESIVEVPVRTQTLSWDKVNSYSFDQQPADVRVSATFHIDPSSVGRVYSQFGPDAYNAIVLRVLQPRVFQELKVVFGRYTAVQAIQDRAKLNSDVFSAVRDSLGGNPEVVLESLQMENIDFSQQYVQSIEARMQAEIEVQRIQQQFQQQEVQAKITVVNAQAAADAQLAQAKVAAQSIELQGEANAKAIQLRGEAEAQVIRSKADALKANPDLVTLTATERWNGVLPTTMVPGGAVPFIGVK